MDTHSIHLPDEEVHLATAGTSAGIFNVVRQQMYSQGRGSSRLARCDGSKMVVPKNDHLVSPVVVSPGCEVFSVHTVRFISSLCSIPALKKGFRNFKFNGN